VGIARRFPDDVQEEVLGARKQPRCHEQPAGTRASLL
jgi:hypothetical protein